MTNVVPGPWKWDSPSPREQEDEARLADVLDFVIGKLEADPDDIRALKDVCWFACRPPFRAVREKAIEAIRQAGDWREEFGRQR